MSDANDTLDTERERERILRAGLGVDAPICTPEDHQRALAEARNEALEEAAKHLESETGDDLAFWAGEIRKLKR